MSPLINKKIFISQSNYIPWKGYFDMIAAADEFIIYDDMQYTRRDWRNRNKIKTPQGSIWITVPVSVSGKYDQKIRDTLIDGRDWSVTHWKTLEQNYRRSKYFDEIASWLSPIYLQEEFTHISKLNRRLIEEICKYLKIHTLISNSWDYLLVEGKTERLVSLCIQACATEYISGPTAKDYINEKFFSDNGIKLSWFDFSNYPEYQQQWGAFSHNVSILDLLFNCGINSSVYMKHT